MKTLFIANRMPPIASVGDFGAERRFRLFVEALTPVSNKIKFLTFAPQSFVDSTDSRKLIEQVRLSDNSDWEMIANERRIENFLNHYAKGIFDARYCNIFAPYAGRAAIATVNKTLLERFDLIVVMQLTAMIPMLSLRTEIPIFFDMDDVLHKVHWRAAMVPPLRPGNILYMLQTPAIMALQRRAIMLSACVTVCAEADRRLISRLGAGTRSAVVPNAVDYPATIGPLTPAPTLLFLGNHAYQPNAIAAERLIKRIWPRIRAARPDATLMIAGNAIEKISGFVGSIEGIECLGYVSDLADLYAKTKIVCCPIDVGGGTRIKLIEGAAYGKPMVSTTIGAEGLDFDDGTEIILRDDDSQFADACVELLGDHARSEHLGLAARAKMHALYEASNVRDQITKLAQGIVR